MRHICIHMMKNYCKKRKNDLPLATLIKNYKNKTLCKNT